MVSRQSSPIGARRAALVVGALAVALVAWWAWPRAPAAPTTSPVAQPHAETQQRAAVTGLAQPATVVQVPSLPAILPGLRQPAELGPGEPFQVEMQRGGPATGRLWPSARRGAPLLLAAAGPGETAASWLQLLRTLKAEREVSLAVLDGGPETGGGVVAVRGASERIDAVARLLRARSVFRDVHLAVLGANEAGTAALEFAAHDSGVRAVAALSPTWTQDDMLMADSLELLARRPVFLAWGSADPMAEPGMAMTRSLQNRRLASAPGDARGLPLLEKARVRSDLAGWLFATLGPQQ